MKRKRKQQLERPIPPLPTELHQLVHGHVCYQATSVRDLARWFATDSKRQRVWSTDRDFLHRSLYIIRRNTRIPREAVDRPLILFKPLMVVHRDVLILAMAARIYDFTIASLVVSDEPSINDQRQWLMKLIAEDAIRLFQQSVTNDKVRPMIPHITEYIHEVAWDSVIPPLLLDVFNLVNVWLTTRHGCCMCFCLSKQYHFAPYTNNVFMAAQPLLVLWPPGVPR